MKKVPQNLRDWKRAQQNRLEKNASPAWMKLSVGLVLHGILLRVKRLKALFHTSIVDAQELVLSGGHIDKVRLALGAFLIEKLVHRLICWGFSQVSADNLVQCFPQMG